MSHSIVHEVAKSLFNLHKIMVARNDTELFGADYAANAVFEIGNSKMSIGNH